MDGKPTRGHALSQLTTFSRFRDPTFDTYYPIQNNVVRNESINARAGVVKERKMTLVSGLQLYPKAIAWSMLLSCTIVMEGYDKSLIGSFFASPSFTQRFGTLSAHNGPTDGQTYQLSTGWQTGLINASIGAEIFGLFLNGYLTDRFGYKKTMLGALVFMNFAIFVSFFAVSLEMLLVSQLLCGLPWGVFQTLSATYAAEVLPVALRPYLLSNINMCWVLGQLTGVGVVHALFDTGSEWSYRVPLALQWAWAIMITVGAVFAPEGPWWLIRKNRINDARTSLTRLTRSKDVRIDVDQMITVMQHTKRIETEYNQDGASYLDCFRGTNLRRTEITCMVWLTQALCGATLIGYAPYFYEQAGFNQGESFKLATGVFGLAILGNMISWPLLPRIGRRQLYIWGLLVLFAVQLSAALVSVTVSEHDSLNWIIGSLVMGLIFAYNITIGPVCYTLVAEIPSTQLRLRTVVLARVAYNCATIGNNILTPLMLNPTAWNWRGKSCFWFTATTLLCLAWCFYRLPESKGLSYLELDILFAKNAPAHKFRQFQINLESSGYLGLNQVESSPGIWHGWRGYS